MAILLDTCALISLGAAPQELSEPAQRALAVPDQEVFVSAISALEIGIKVRKGKLTLPAPAIQWFPSVVAALGIREIPVTADAALAAAALDWDHADPADRIIVITAQRSHLAIVTADATIAQFGRVQVVW